MPWLDVLVSRAVASLPAAKHARSPRPHTALFHRLQPLSGFARPIACYFSPYAWYFGSFAIQFLNSRNRRSRTYGRASATLVVSPGSFSS